MNFTLTIEVGETVFDALHLLAKLLYPRLTPEPGPDPNDPRESLPAKPAEPDEVEPPKAEPKTRKAKAPKAAEPVELENTAPEPVSPTITLDAINLACQALVKDLGGAKAKAKVLEILKKYGATKLSELKAEHYPDFAVDLGIA